MTRRTILFVLVGLAVAVGTFAAWVPPLPEDEPVLEAPS